MASVSDSTARRIKARDGFVCVYCAADLTANPSVAEVDHVTPRAWFADGSAAGNPDDAANLVTACAPCNNRKGVMDLATFAFYLRARYGVDTRPMVRRVNAARRRPLPST
jgi:5-methylcytosine-specific restriction endonuclease McrA